MPRASPPTIPPSSEERKLLPVAPLFCPTRPTDVFGCLFRDSPPLTLDEMDAAVAAEARRRGARD